MARTGRAMRRAMRTPRRRSRERAGERLRRRFAEEGTEVGRVVEVMERDRAFGRIEDESSSARRGAESENQLEESSATCIIEVR
jgi:membrane protein implicated in regulation of membrane protease activity